MAGPDMTVGVPQDCPDYPQCEADRLVLEGDKFQAAKASQKFTGVDDLHADPNDPNFGDYNIPPGGNHP